MQNLITIITCLVLILVSCSRQEDSQNVQQQGNATRILQLKEVSLQRELPGKRPYIHYCSFCHSESGHGDGFNAWSLNPKPRNFTDIDFMSSVTDQQLYNVISNGGGGVGKSKSMPPWGSTLTKEEIQRVISYIRTFSKKNTLK